MKNFNLNSINPNARFVNSGKPYALKNANMDLIDLILKAYPEDEVVNKTGKVFQNLTIIGGKIDLLNIINVVLDNIGIQKFISNNSKKDKVEKLFPMINEKKVRFSDFIKKSYSEMEDFIKECDKFLPIIKFNSFHPSDNAGSILTLTIDLDGENNLTSEDTKATSNKIFQPVTTEVVDNVKDLAKKMIEPYPFSYRDIIGGIVALYPNTRWILDFYNEIELYDYSVDKLYNQSIYYINNGKFTDSVHVNLNNINEIIGNNICSLHFFTEMYKYNVTVLNEIIEYKKEMIEGKKLLLSQNPDIIDADFSTIDFIEREISREQKILKINKSSLRKEFLFSMDSPTLSVIRKKRNYWIELEYDPSDGDYFVRLVDRKNIKL